MSTATEMELRMLEAARKLKPLMDAMNVSLNSLALDTHVTMFGRYVCAKRARKLRKRGDDVRFSHWTSTGKATYQWLPQVRFKVKLS